MGCDIHGWIEKRVDGKWLAHRNISGGDYNDYHTNVEHVDLDGRRYGRIEELKDRNYGFFGKLAGVRHSFDDSLEPQGFPDDASLECRKDFEADGSDAHTPSWVMLEEAARCYYESRFRWPANVSDDCSLEPMTNAEKLFPCEPFGIPVPDGEYRFVFWFDN